MIHSILTNPTYTGDLAQGRSRVKSYKVHQIEAVPREEWVEVAGTHEAIIDYETFDKVQALLQRDTRTSPKGREVHLFSGFLKCADCGRAITRCVGKNNNVYYSCSTYKNRSRTACTIQRHYECSVIVWSCGVGEADARPRTLDGEERHEHLAWCRSQWRLP